MKAMKPEPLVHDVAYRGFPYYFPILSILP